MAAKLEKVKGHPGIYRRGGRYVFSYRVEGADGKVKQRWESRRTLLEARDAKSERVTDINRGRRELAAAPVLADYARSWIKHYPGTGRRGFSEDTRREYGRDLERYVIPRLGLLRLDTITPQHVAEFVGWLCDDDAQRARALAERVARTGEAPEKAAVALAGSYCLADATVRRILAPLRSCLRSAMRAFPTVLHNPTQGVALPVRDEHRRIAEGSDNLDDGQDVRCLETEQLAALLLVAPARHRVLFETLAATGMRISEGLALRWGDLVLDGEHPVVKVRRAYVRGTMKPPKSKYGKREIPIDHELVRALRQAGPGDPRALVFPADDGTPLHASNLLMRAFKPAAEEAGVPWAGFHTLRHTCASMLFDQGRNAVQVQHWLGHHSAAFTLNTYVHLLDKDVGQPLSLPRPGANKVQTCPAPDGGTVTIGREVNVEA